MQVAKIDLKGFVETRVGLNNEGSFMLKDILDELPKMGEGVWVAGGAVRKTLLGDTIDTDIDFFFSDPKALREYREELDDRGNRLSSNDHQTTYELFVPYGEVDTKVIVQLVHIDFYEKVEDLLDSFDFTLCQVAIDHKGDCYVNPLALYDIANKRIVIHKITYGTASLRRLIKYSKQGFYACGGALATFLNTVAENPSVIKEEIKYVD